MTVKVYNAQFVIATFGPINLFPGRNRDEFLSIEEDEDSVSEEIGLDGEVCISPGISDIAKIELTIMQSSTVNDQLSIIHNLRRVPGMAGAIHPFFVKDGNGNALYTAANTWISKAPPVKFGEKPQTRVWTFKCAELVRVDGGNLPAL